jgi:hypothetical protein
MPVVGDEFVVSTPAEWRAVSSATRFEIIEFMRMLPACSLAELGQAMARPADGLYHHMRQLVRAGLVLRTVHRNAAGRSEAIYELRRRAFRFDVDPVSGRNSRVLAALVDTLTRLADKSVRRALDARLPVGSGDTKQIWARSETSWLADADLAELNAHFRAIDAIFDHGRAQRRGRLFFTSFFLCPAVRPDRTRPRPEGTRLRPESKRVRHERARVQSKQKHKRKGAKAWIVPTA